ncbi:ankyrin repeat domain-containing protein 60-like [Brienomyrus brachyistius]|uniref:ankyrin repeat domain-containing protein 60-like n=1 Tax=Brienomyrus brachyistius TaxID=42636 RepID=UPI0020B19B0A|nr:ankyrin repeat domain-containing protein 60-like [Brienomyrus brachyistius]
MVLTKTNASFRVHMRKLPSRKPKASGVTDRTSKKLEYSVQVSLRDTGELFTVHKCRGRTKICELKTALELIAGIPSDCQRLSYLDQGDLVDESTFNFNGIIARSIITMMIWPYNGLPALVRAAVSGDICKLMSILGRSDSAGSSQPLGTSLPSPWPSHRLFPALFVSTHRGKKAAVQFLIANGACVKSQTPQGRTALHAAAYQGCTECIDILVAAGAPVHVRDLGGVAPIDAARHAGHQTSVRLLSLSRWQERTAEARPRFHLDPSELFAHQHFCSNLRTCLCGPQAQRYMAQMRSRGREPRSQLCPVVSQHGKRHRLHQQHSHLCEELRATQ